MDTTPSAAQERSRARLALRHAFAVQVGAEGLQFVELGDAAPGPVRVDFLEGAVAHRRRFGGGSGQMIAKAVGVGAGIRPSVLDATAGLGRDAFVLATLGCTVSLIERQPLIAALLEDGLARAAGDAEVGSIVARMRLLVGNAIELIGALRGRFTTTRWLARARAACNSAGASRSSPTSGRNRRISFFTNALLSRWGNIGSR